MFFSDLPPYYHYTEQDRDYICSQPDANGMHSCNAIPPVKNNGVVCNESAWSIASMSNDSCVNWNQYYSDCKSQGQNPFQGTISFDNIGLAWVAIFVVRRNYEYFVGIFNLDWKILLVGEKWNQMLLKVSSRKMALRRIFLHFLKRNCPEENYLGIFRYNFFISSRKISQIKFIYPFSVRFPPFLSKNSKFGYFRYDFFHFLSENSSIKNVFIKFIVYLLSLL